MKKAAPHKEKRPGLFDAEGTLYTQRGKESLPRKKRILSVAILAPVIVLTAMAGEARRRVDLAVDFMLVYVVAPVRHGALGLVLVLVTRLDLFFVRVAVGTEGFHVADAADLPLLLGEEPVS